MKKSVKWSKGSLLFALVFLFTLGFTGAFLSDEAVAQIRPAYTKNVDEPGRQPYEVWVEFTKFGCSWNCKDFLDFSPNYLFDLDPVPAGKRWVIVKASGRIPTVDPSAAVALQSQVIISFQFVKWSFHGPFFPMTSVNAGLSGFSADVFTTYGPGEIPHINVYAPDPSNYFSYIVLSGYLIDAN
jgi:hypothetical protein